VQLSPEFRLAAACCRWPASARRGEAVRAAASEPGLHWTHFLAVVRRHRVEGLVHDGLGRAGVVAPPPVAEALRKAATSIAAENLRYAGEAGKLARALEDSGVAHLFLKGLTLNILAYGTLAIKKSADLDIVVEPGGLEGAIDAVEALGYACVSPFPGATRPQILAFAARAKDTLWLRGSLAIEIHHGFVDSPLMLPEVTVRSPRQVVPVAPGVELPTLAKDELFAYLCVHGATHAWSRLKWIADVGALLAGESPEEIGRLHRRAVEMGAGRATAQALRLAADLFGLPIGEKLERELKGDRTIAYLVRTAKAAMVQGGGVAELDDLVLGTAAIHLSHFRLMPGWRYKRAELRRKLATVAAPGESGAFLAPLLAGPRWLWRRLKRRGALASARTREG
jgi:hypothetical protein